MTIINNRENELSFESIVEKYPQIPRLIILKIDVQRRGVHYTQKVLDKIDPNIYQLTGANVFFASLGARDQKTRAVPESLILRDGTTIITDPTPLAQNPYIVDYRDGKSVLVDNNKIIEEVNFWEKPDYYGELTSSGVSMDSIVFARPQRLNITPTSYCHFWKNQRGCKYCDLVPHFKEDGVIKQRLTPQDAYETVREALKQKGRFTNICMTMGSDTNGATPFDAEVDYYIEILKAIGQNFKEKRFPSQVITTALNEEQLVRLYNETGLTSYTSDIEVLNEDLFKWICPGKEEWVGYKEWKRRLVAAVDIFGKGNVNSGIVGGVELAKPNGFKTEEEGLKHTLEEAEDLISKGVSVVYIVWVPRPLSFFKDQKNASLEYYVKLTEGLNTLRIKYGSTIDFNDIKHIINNSKTLKVLATVGIDGIPHTAVKQTLHINEDGNIEYIELFESSQSYRNLTASVWYDKKVSILIYGENKESYEIIGKTENIYISGKHYEKAYTDILEQKGFDIAAIVIIIPEYVKNQDPKEKFQEQERTRPFFRHLDRLKK